MAFTINTNLMAANSARVLGQNYDKLATSTQRLSSGLRINSAADDAAGLAIRELMRSDIATQRQGIRNANDAISMIQVADGALAVIDEKLIRMKELAEQASTGTYNSVQRLILDSEFQAMAAEIDRISASTDFNGIKLLDGSMQGIHDGSRMNSTGSTKIHFGTGNSSAEDYYYLNIRSCSAGSLLFPELMEQWPGSRTSGNRIEMSRTNVLAGTNKNSVPGLPGIDYYPIPAELTDITIESRSHGAPGGGAHKPHVNLFTSSGQQLTGYDPADPANNQGWNGLTQAAVINAGKRQGLFDPGATYTNTIINNAGQSITAGGTTVTITASQNPIKDQWEAIHVDEAAEDLVFMLGGHLNPGCNDYDLRITATLPMDIKTQEQAQTMLGRVDKAVEGKDNVRADLGAMQNRLENTITSLTIEAENMQAAESRISDTDVATEMTQHVKMQILSQSAIAMLTQANNMPKMAMQLISA